MTTHSEIRRLAIRAFVLLKIAVACVWTALGPVLHNPWLAVPLLLVGFLATFLLAWTLLDLNVEIAWERAQRERIARATAGWTTVQV